MGSKLGEPLSGIDRDYVLGTGIALEVAAVLYLGFPVITPAAVVAGIGYAAYKVGQIAVEEIKCISRDKSKRERRRNLLRKDVSSRLVA